MKIEGSWEHKARMDVLILSGASAIPHRVLSAEAKGGDSTTDQFTPRNGKRLSQKTLNGFCKKKQKMKESF